jgi:hypothetical protein
MDRRPSPLAPSRRRCRPGLEGLEGRELLSSVPISNIPLPNRPTLTPSSYGPPTPGHASYAGALQPDGSANFINQLQQQVYPNSTPYPNSTNGSTPLPAQPASATTTVYNPTQAEQAREYFVGVASGTYTVTPGRFSNQGYTIHAFSKEANSNTFLNGRSQLLLFTPAVDPTTQSSLPAFTPTYANTNGVYNGLGVFVPLNALTTSSELIFDLGPRQTTAVKNINGINLPTSINFTVDPTGIGAFTDAAGFGQGGGTLNITYTPDKTPKGGAIQSGKITYVFQGLVNTSSILSVIERSIN